MKRLSKGAREASRKRAEAHQQSIKERKEARRDNEAARQSAVRAALEAGPRDVVTQILCSSDRGPRRSFFEAIEKRAPRLLTLDYKRGLDRLFDLPHVRPIEEWRPDGKGRDTQYRSLCEHLLAKYPTPGFLWSGLLDEENCYELSVLVSFLAAGESFYQLCKQGYFTIPLTRAQCHEILQTPNSTPFMHAVRQAQIRAEKGDRRLHEAWMKTNQGIVLHDPEDEAFWLTVIRFFAQNPMIDPTQVGPLVDYINFRRDDKFTMKGRTGTSLLRDMEVWHGELARAKTVENHTYKASGFKEGAFDLSRLKNGDRIPEVWRITEILSSRDLLKEGKNLHHCVWSYSRSVHMGHTSIWSLNVDEGAGPDKRITVEVWNQTRMIAQARGNYNRLTTAKEHSLIVKWATKNGLTFRNHAW